MADLDDDDKEAEEKVIKTVRSPEKVRRPYVKPQPVPVDRATHEELEALEAELDVCLLTFFF